MNLVHSWLWENKYGVTNLSSKEMFFASLLGVFGLLFFGFILSVMLCALFVVTVWIWRGYQSGRDRYMTYTLRSMDTKTRYMTLIDD